MQSVVGVNNLKSSARAGNGWDFATFRKDDFSEAGWDPGCLSGTRRDSGEFSTEDRRDASPRDFDGVENPFGM
jgi:hypothetical protein